MLFSKIKITPKYEIKDYYIAHEVLLCPPGILLEVSFDSVANKGDIVKKIDNKDHPLISVSTKINTEIGTDMIKSSNLWGKSLHGYGFKTLYGKKESDYIKS
jgi:hypothetical protein